jgi:hypothetical protein
MTAKKRCIEKMKAFDVLFVKPFLIYKFDRDGHKRVKEFHEHLVKRGDEVEEIVKSGGAVGSNEGNNVRMSLVEALTTRNRDKVTGGMPKFGMEEELIVERLDS